MLEIKTRLIKEIIIIIIMIIIIIIVTLFVNFFFFFFLGGGGGGIKIAKNFTMEEMIIGKFYFMKIGG